MIYLARHGETSWTISRQHTGRTDIPLTPRGETNARQLGSRLVGVEFARVFTSPLQRADGRANWQDSASDRRSIPIWPRWTTAAMRDERRRTFARKPRIGISFATVARTANRSRRLPLASNRVIARLRSYRQGNTLLFTHMHFLRFLAARWIALPAIEGRRFLLSTASLSILGYDHTLDKPAIRLWNDDRHVAP